MDPASLIYPMFLCEGSGEAQPIETMPGQFRYSPDRLVEVCAENLALGITTVNLFGSTPHKSDLAEEATNPDGLVPQAVRLLKSELPALNVQTDLALDPYTPHGHDGLILNGKVDNDATISVLQKMAKMHAEAGVDWVAPSDMMDGRIGAIRHFLDMHGHIHVSILAYTAKYASCFYGPFRGALETAPLSGLTDKLTYQMDPANRREAVREAMQDIQEGADAIMVKPASHYLDVIHALRERTQVPIAAYQVSGEYAMIQAAAEKGWLDADQAMIESLTSIRRAGADMILTYFAPAMARKCRQEILHD
jgi:porphobilinogen synthase